MDRVLFHGEPQLARLIGASPAIVAIRAEIAKIADAASSVLITGPSGSGKDVVAQKLHQRSRRAARPFVAINCAALPADLLESELFGHEQGAFTGAVKARAGRFEAAHGGTLFLDEVGDMPMAMQAKLLRTLETRVVERVGGMLPIPVDVRVVGATGVDLQAAVAAGRFRADLMYRLDVIHIHLPALAQRPEDVPPLVEHFLAHHRQPVRFTPAAIAVLMAWPWPGNVRELRNFIERACVHHPGEIIGSEGLACLLRTSHRDPDPDPELAPKPIKLPRMAALHAPKSSHAAPAKQLPQLGPDGMDLRQHLADLECAYIRQALAFTGGTIARTARLLGLQRTTLIEKMRRFEIAAHANDLGDRPIEERGEEWRSSLGAEPAID
ncbi:sigma-54 dependent transcriptional regulator [Sandarakinorhabdus sp.]|uniref:sigma-54 interaction domain-containing protein n=1 Tax=Sandarakinorhabdus sp. TaxID=1916663 RepID=UPI0033426C54